MLVSQLIYTSWKNGDSPNKGFMVYSKTQDINEEEERCILSVMRYKTLPSLPYDPTMEEIETMFPRNFAYFRLPTGRYCMAQSSYIGWDYSPRLGNYIIHAFVFDENSAFEPATYIGSDIFRRRLTDAELNAPSNPPPLKQLDIPNQDKPLGQAALQQFFTQERKNTLKLLVQACLHMANTKSTIYFCDEDKNLKYWLEALSYILPKKAYQNLRFGTYMYKNTSADYLNFICEPEKVTATIYNSEESQDKTFAFDLRNRNITITEEQNGYIDRLVNVFCNNPKDCTLYSNEINVICQKYNINDCALAEKLRCFAKGDFAWITNIDEMLDMLTLYSSNQAEFKKDLLPKILATAKANAAWTQNEKILQLYQRLFPAVDTALQEDIALLYLNYQLQRFNGNDGTKFYQQIKAECFFDWGFMSQWLLKPTTISYLLQLNKEYLNFFLLHVVSAMYQALGQKTASLEQYMQLILSIYHRFNVRDIKLIVKVTELLKGYDATLSNAFLAKILEEERQAMTVNIPYMLDMLALVDYAPNYFWPLFIESKQLQPNNVERLMNSYMDLKSRQANKIAVVEKVASQYPGAEKFLQEIELRSLETQEDKPKKEDIFAIYVKHVKNPIATEQDKQRAWKIVYGKTKDFFEQVKGKERIDSAIYFYRSFKAENALKKEFLEIFNAAIFNGTPLKELKKNLSYDTARELFNSFNEYQIIPASRCCLYMEGELFAEAMGNRAMALQCLLDARNAKQIWYCVQKLSPLDANDFAETYLSDILRFCCYEGFMFATNIELLLPVLCRTNCFVKKVVEEMQRMKTRPDQMQLIALYCNYIFSHNNALNDQLKVAFEEFIFSLKKDERATFVDNLQKAVLYPAPLKEWMEIHEEKHKGFFAKLFGRFNKKQEKPEQKRSK